MRKGEVETIAYNRDKGVGVTVYIGQRRGHASTADFADEAIRATVEKAAGDRALHGARTRSPDSPIRDRLARDWPDLDLYHPWELPVDEAIELGRETEAAALAVDRRHHQQRGRDRLARRVGVRLRQFERILRRLSQLAPSHRLRGDRRGRRRDAARLLVHGGARAATICCRRAEVGRIAGERTARRLGARQLATLECPVLFEAPEAADLIGVLRAAPCPAAACIANRRSCSIRSASRCSRRSSTSARSRTCSARRGSAPFDNEGVATTPRESSPTAWSAAISSAATRARKLGMTTTGNAGGAHNLVVAPGDRRSRGADARAWGAGCSSPSSSGRASIRSPATTRAAPRASGSKTARSRTRSRRSRSPAT